MCSHASGACRFRARCRRLRLAAWTVLGAVVGVSAVHAAPVDLRLGMTLEFNSYVIGEPIVCAVRLENQGAAPFIVDDYGAYLQNRIDFDIQRRPNHTVRRFDTEGGVARLMLLPGEGETYEIDLTRHYPLSREGRYLMRTIARAGAERFETSLRMFDVVPGLELDRVTGSVPDQPDIRRTYQLVYWARAQSETLFLRATDAPGERVLRTVRLGSLVRATPPTLQVERNGRVTIRHQATRDDHVKTVLQSLPGGLRLIEQTLDEDHGTTPLRRALEQQRRRAEERDATP